MEREALEAAEKILVRNLYGVLGEIVVLGTILLIGEVAKHMARRMCEDRFLEGYEGHGLGV